jgi:hypothetical protein
MLPALACPHIATGQGFRRGMMPSTVLGEGGLVSTVHDLMRWTAFLRHPHIGSAATWREMLKPAHFPRSGDGTYALGLVDERHRGMRVLHHAGAVLGANSQMLVAPEHELGLAILVNRSDVSATELGWKVLDALLGEKLTPATPVATATTGVATGFHVHAGSGRTIALEVVDGCLCFDHQSQYAPLTADGDAFVLNQIGLKPTRLKIAGEGSGAVVLHEQAGTALRFDRMHPVDSLPYLAHMEGRYFSAETDTEIRIHADGPAQCEIRGPYGRSLWRLEALCADAHRDEELPGFWLLRPHGPAPVRWIAMRLRVRGATVQALEINTPRTWALHFERI